MFRYWATSLLFLLIPLPVWGSKPNPTAIDIGITDLINTAQATIGYQIDGRTPATLGYGWTGFDDLSGVWFVPEQVANAMNQVFIHSPYRQGPGVAFADFAITLPRTKRVRLCFEIGLRPTAKDTDGVTYRIRGDGKILFSRHCTWTDFQSCECDLTAYAGKRLLLRLEVDPGPKRESHCDWSLWRNVQILAGTDQEIRASTARMQAARARHRAEAIDRGKNLAHQNLSPFSSRNCLTACPSLVQPAVNSMRKDGGTYVFRCQADETIEYRLDPAKGLLTGLSVSIDGRPLQPSPFRGGPRVYLNGHEFATPTHRLETTLIDLKKTGQSLLCHYRFRHAKSGQTATMTAKLWAVGKSLGLKVESAGDAFSGFSVTRYGGREVPAAFAVGGAPHWRPEGMYIAAVADPMQSDASSVGLYGVRYGRLTNGHRNPLHDVFYLTVSSRYEETLSNVSHDASPFLDELSRRVVLDVWGGSFADDQQWLQRMASYGIDGLLIIKHVWQRDGYDRTYPNTMPANARQGGDQALRSLSNTARQLGHRFCVHENFYDYYPNAEDFRPEDCALNSAGKPQTGWDRGPVTALFLKPSLLMQYARKFSPEVKRRYGCNAAYHDIMPTSRVDFDANVPNAGKLRVTHDATRALCDYDRTLFSGPVVFEAAAAGMAGVYDGGCNRGTDTYRILPAVAYELLKVHPKMTNHGFGYYERWLPWGYNDGWQTYVMTDRELDKYRAYEIAFGRTGFIGRQLMKHPHGVVREYHLMQAFARSYTGREVKHIEYRMDGAWVDAGTTARFGEFNALHVEYQDRQHVYVNLSATPLRVAEHELPQFGTLTIGPRATAWTAIRQEQICDYAQYDHLTYVDARSHVWLPPKQLAPIEPSVASYQYLGGGRFSLAVKWKVGRTLKRDYRVFWHFRDAGEIKFQRDFHPSRPVTQWQVGDDIVTGPQSLSVKEDASASSYDVFVGLYDKQGRVSLLGGADEVHIARLVIQRLGTKTQSIRLEPIAPLGLPGTSPAPYRHGMNQKKNVIDFGCLATNGALVANQQADSLILTPVPSGEVMTIGLDRAITTIQARDMHGTVIPSPRLRRDHGKTWFETTPDATSYRVDF